MSYPAADVRTAEINSLRAKYPNIMWYGPSTFHIPIQLPLNKQLYLSITIPDRFPQAPPVIQALQRCQHPWVDNQGYFSFSPIAQSWTPTNPSLNFMLDYITRTFSTQPPTIFSNYFAPSGGTTTPHNPPTPAPGPLSPTHGAQNNPFPGQPPPPSHPHPSQVQQQQPQQPQQVNRTPTQIPQQAPQQQQQQPPQQQPVQLNPTQQRIQEIAQLSQEIKSVLRPRSAIIPASPNVHYHKAAPYNDYCFDPRILDTLTDEQLLELDDNPNAMKEFILTKIPVLLTLSNQVNETENEVLALQKKTDDEKEKQKDLDKKQDELKSELLAQDEKISYLRDEFIRISSTYTVDNVLNELKKQINELENDTDNILDLFAAHKYNKKDLLNEEDILNTFLDEYLDVRQQLHFKELLMKRLSHTYNV